ncbi:dihydrolipoyl dehydrogenase [Haloarcula marismortui]|uniref:Dihydrolipoyl dehydrogenase n=1 Tax=Haloarcula marismortui ATCC 33800 TaxID=662476 RepID=M0JLH9_9EURY|nr:dihydrolipoyl dehydrogenase [Haloarcula sinaiiensis]EMA08854.1 dihydrolipoamide dehydrogenase [Haloarcula sinaiiensis ATCC 33800]QUJ74173.1 dihydrolipoyl dehydrogenase [Haloarcula sinaiiensis ATCC 33800]
MVVGDVTTSTDVLVIGAGPGGYVAAIRAAQLDLDVTLVEKGAYGGACLNRGCIPSKALINGSRLASEAGNAEELGIYADPTVALDEMISWKDGVVDQLTSGIEQLCTAAGVNLLNGTAKFAAENKIRIVHQGEGQGSESLKFEYCIIATGSRPIEIPEFDFDDERIVSSDGALNFETVPDELVIVGAGYIGMELATVYSRLGSDVSVVEMLEQALPSYQEDVASIVRKRAERLGVDFHFGYTADSWAKSDGKAALTAVPADEAAHDSAIELTADRILVAVGRRPVTDTLSIDDAGVETNAQGFIPTDSRCRTNKEHIFAVGDVAGEPMLAHKGSKEGEVAAEVIAGEPAAVDYQALPAAVFTDPEIGTVGLTENEAANEGMTPVTGEFQFQASGRALTANRTEGFVRIVAAKETERVIGAQIVGPEASELIAEIAAMIEMGAKLQDIGSTVHTHPTLSEAIMEAAQNARGKAIHRRN